MTDEKYTLIKNLRLIDARARRTDGCDLLFLVKDQKSQILEIGKNLKAPDIDGTKVLNAHGRMACPAFTDLRCSIPDPGFPHRETVATGLSAAVSGGYAQVLLMPAAKPMPDSRAAVRALKQNCTAMSDCLAEIAVPLTKEGKGRQLCNFAELKEAGAKAVSCMGEEKEPLTADLCKGICECKKHGLLFIAPVDDKSLGKRGFVNKGRMSRRFKDEGIDPFGELAALSRAVLLAREFETPVHFPIVTLKKSVEMVRRAKKESVPITCGTAPPYFSFTEEELLFSGSSAKLYPPLREEENRMAVIEGLADGTVDCICSDHTPCHDAEKEKALRDAAFGSVGIETALGAGITHLVIPGYLSLYRLIELMALAPADILQRDASIRPGSACNLALINPEAELVYSKHTLHSRSSNTPFLGRALRGRVTGLYIDGTVQF